MADEINLSRNELWALLVKVFEALFGHQRDYYDMARTVLWLECLGHKGVKQLVESLPILENGSLPEATLAEISDTHFVMDGGGRSLLDIGPSLSDLAIACASENGVARMDVFNVRSSAALVVALPFIARQGFHGIAMGPDTVSMISPNHDCPTVFSQSSKGQLSLICSQYGIDVSENVEDERSVLKTVEIQTEFFSACLENGINIPTSEFEALKDVAANILVEATEASRRGAGE